MMAAKLRGALEGVRGALAGMEQAVNAWGESLAEQGHAQGTYRKAKQQLDGALQVIEAELGVSAAGTLSGDPGGKAAA
jgi:hypothetical protein